jgi:hypothetical protein
MEKFRIAAKLTHKIYGTRSAPAVYDRLKKYRVVSRMHTHNSTMLTNPARGDLSPKNIIDHDAFSAS